MKAWFSNFIFKVEYNYAAYQWRKLLGPSKVLCDTDYDWEEWKQYKKDLKNDTVRPYFE